MNMIVQPSRFAVGGGGGGFTPDTVTGLVAWYDVSTFAGSDGDPITTWPDLANSFDGTDGGTQKASLQVAEQNGLNVAQFSPSGGNWPSITMSTSLMNSATEGTFFAVFKLASDPPTGSAGGALIDGFTDAGLGPAHHPFTDGNIYDNFGTVSFRTVGNPTPSMSSTYRIYSARTATNDWKAFLDGVQLVTFGTNTPFFGTSQTKYIGRNKSTQKFEGFIAEILIFDAAISSSDREKVEGYLAHKWGIAANLDGGHPYKVSPP
jgi:hypothetical protein